MKKPARQDAYILVEQRAGANPTMEVVGSSRDEIITMLAEILTEDAGQGYQLTNLLQDAITKSKLLIRQRCQDDIDYLMKIPQEIKN